MIQTRDIVLSDAYRHWHWHFHFLSVRPPGPVRLDLRSSRYSIIPCHVMQQQLLAWHMHMQFDPHIEQQRRSTGSQNTSSQFDIMMIELYTPVWGMPVGDEEKRTVREDDHAAHIRSCTGQPRSLFSSRSISFILTGVTNCMGKVRPLMV